MGTRCADHVTPLYPQKLALPSPTSGGRSVGIVRSRTKATEFSLVFFSHLKSALYSVINYFSEGQRPGSTWLLPHIILFWRAFIDTYTLLLLQVWGNGLGLLSCKILLLLNSCSSHGYICFSKSTNDLGWTFYATWNAAGNLQSHYSEYEISFSY